jgi:hypothetical protein
MIQTIGMPSGGPRDSFRGTVEQGCPICRWFGHVGAFPAHWKTHSLIDRAAYRVDRWLQHWYL